MAPATVPRRTGTRRAAIPVLPEELVVWEILVRLPAKALLRCRAVCRSWRRLTSAADFLLVHHRHQPSLPLVSFRSQIHASSDDVVDAVIDAFDIQGAPDAAERRPVLCFNDYNHRRHFSVYGSCDGLLLLSLSNNRFYICNPATRQWTALPNLTGSHVAGLFKHSWSGEYCILYWKGSHLVGNAVYFVLTVGSSVEPRCIGQPVASPSIEQCITAGIMYTSAHPPALLRSCLHWVGLSLKRGLIVFDTIAEKFRFMHSPTASNWEPSLLEINGTLGISRINSCGTTVELWVLQDYEAEVWSLKYRIELPVVEMRNIANNHCFNGIVVSEKGDILVHSFGSWHMFHCDSKGKLQQKFRWDCVLPRPIGHWFKESLVNHVFFQRLGCVGQPRFFHDL